MVAKGGIRLGNLSYKQIRQLAGLTQDALAKICDVDRRTVARFESGISQNFKLQKWYEESWVKTKTELKSNKQ